MAWQLIYDIRQTPPPTYATSAMVAIMAAATLAYAFYAALYQRAGSRKTETLAAAAVCCALGLVAWVMLPNVEAYHRLCDSLASGHFAEIEGRTAGTHIIDRRRGSTVLFQAGGHEFVFPYGSPRSCLPQNGEAVKIDYTPKPGPGLNGVNDTIVRMYMTRGCPFDVFR